MHGLNHFMRGIIDYAGLFPPAELAMEPTVSNYGRFRAGQQAWMLGRLICPAQRMAELAGCLESVLTASGSADAWHVSALAAAEANETGLFAGFGQDLSAVARLIERFPRQIVVDVLECRLPAQLVSEGDAAGVRNFAAEAADVLGKTLPGPITPFFEVPFAGDWQDTVPVAIAGLAQYNARAATRGAEPSGRVRPCGVKVRTGGVAAHQFPTVAQVATLIAACRREGIAFKATAGLHHPVRHYDDSVATHMHGFVNVFGAAILAWHHHLDVAALEQIIAEEDRGAFRFDDEGFAWRNSRVRSAQIDAARAAFALSFGSCSFDEPVEDLKASGWL